MTKKPGIPPVSKEDLVQSTKSTLLSVFTPDATINFLLRNFTSWDLINMQATIKKDVLHEEMDKKL
jgi:hypothetical protein